MAAPKTPKGAKSDKEWRDALRLALHEEVDDGAGGKTKALRLVARKVIDRALEGDMAAAKEIGDRLDGRPAQVIAGDGDAPLKLIVERIVLNDDPETIEAEPLKLIASD